MTVKPNHRHLSIYEVYVRAHSQEGSFSAVTKDLGRIGNLGIDVIWLTPIHPIGQFKRKGTLGCPYSISDYLSVNPEYGPLDDFKDLLSAAHKLNMQVLIDIVFNHTAHDSKLAKDYPEFFYQHQKTPINRVAEWSDIIDLNYQSSRRLWEIQIDTLKYWRDLGVDGFRCDVASLVPLEFWREAKEKVGGLWLAESVHPAFAKKMRAQGVYVCDDHDLYLAFDITYDHDGHEYFMDLINKKIQLQDYIAYILTQEQIYPADYSKLRFVENHDQPRFCHFFPDREQRLTWTAMQFFFRGACLVYAGQEVEAETTPSLFEKDPIYWEFTSAKSIEYSDFLKRLFAIKKDKIFNDGEFRCEAQHNVVIARYIGPSRTLWGIFNLTDQIANVDIDGLSAEYQNKLTGSKGYIDNGQLTCQPYERNIFVN